MSFPFFKVINVSEESKTILGLVHVHTDFLDWYMYILIS